MVFKSNRQFKKAITQHVVLTKRAVKFVKNEPKRVRAKCMGIVSEEGVQVDKTCKWTIFGSFDRDTKCFLVKTYHNERTCDEEKRVKRLTSKFLAKRFEDLIRSHPDLKIDFSWQL